MLESEVVVDVEAVFAFVVKPQCHVVSHAACHHGYAARVGNSGIECGFGANAPSVGEVGIVDIYEHFGRDAVGTFVGSTLADVEFAELSAQFLLLVGTDCIERQKRCGGAEGGTARYACLDGELPVVDRYAAFEQYLGVVGVGERFDGAAVALAFAGDFLYRGKKRGI